MTTKIKTPIGYKILFMLGKLIGYNVIIMHDSGYTKYSKRIEIHR